MIDFWEIAGRIVLMDPAVRNHDLYDANTGIMPLQDGGCILAGHCDTATLPFPVGAFYDSLRDYLTQKYSGPDALLSPVISMFALGEVGVMLFNQPFRDLFEAVSTYLRTQSAIAGRTDTGSSSLFYIALAVLCVDMTSRQSIAQGNFLGLTQNAADQTALQQVANDATFNTNASALCFQGAWEQGSDNTLRDQMYSNGSIPFRHFRFVANLT